MVLYKGLLSTNYRNAFILNSFFAAFVAVVAVNSNAFFNKLFQDIAAKTTQVVSSIKKNIKETVDKQDNPSYPIPTTPHPSHTPHYHHTYEPYESLTPTPPSTITPPSPRIMLQAKRDPSFISISSAGDFPAEHAGKAWKGEKVGKEGKAREWRDGREWSYGK